MTEIEKKMGEHLDGFETRQSALHAFQSTVLSRFDEAEKSLEEVKKIAIHNTPSPITNTRLGSIEEQMKIVVEKIDLIFPAAKREMEEAEFWNRFWAKVTTGGNGLKWVLGVIVAFIILSGYGKALILAWLGDIRK